MVIATHAGCITSERALQGGLQGRCRSRFTCHTGAALPHLRQLHRVHITPLAPALDRALPPAPLLAVGAWADGVYGEVQWG